MATDYKAGAGPLNPAFMLHMGDIVYGNDKANHYGERFYSPIDATRQGSCDPGNHDGEVRAPADSPSLSAYLANFCDKSAKVAPQAAATGIYRETMTQPGAYWQLDAPFVRIIGLYSNLLENPGISKARKAMEISIRRNSPGSRTHFPPSRKIRKKRRSSSQHIIRRLALAVTTAVSR